jgi:hypothetical protein
VRSCAQLERRVLVADGDELDQVLGQEGGDVARRLVLLNVAQLVPQEAQIMFTVALDENRVTECQPCRAWSERSCLQGGVP